MNKLKILLSLVSILLFFIMFYFAFKDFQRITEILVLSNKIYLLLSLIFFLAFNLYSVYIVKFIYKLFNLELSFKRVFYISFLSILGRYLPGRFWTFTLLIGISKSLNLDIKSITKGILLNQFYLIYSAIPMLCFYFYEIKNYILLFGSIIIFLIFPIVLHFLSKKYEFKIKLNIFLLLLSMFLFMWLLVGLSLYFFILSLNIEINLLYSLLIFPISYNIGILSLIAPAGIGVREGVMIFMLMKFFDIDLSNKISVLFRIFNLIVELILSLIGYILYQTDKK